MLILNKNFDNFIDNFDSLYENLFYNAYKERNVSNIRVKNEGKKVFVELPGIGKDNINAKSIDKNTLNIEWTEKVGEKETTDSMNIRVMAHNDANATYKDGVLIIDLIDDKIRKEIEIK